MGDSIEDGNGSTSEPLLAESASSRGFFGNLFDSDQYTVYKGCDISTLGAWRSRVFALNTVRRLRNVADLKQRKERQASIEARVRSNWKKGKNVTEAAHRFVDQLKVPGKKDGPAHETQGLTDEKAKENGFGIDAEQLSTLVKNKDFEALDNHGGIDSLFDKLKSSQEQGLQTCEERELEIRRDIFSTNTYIEKPPKGFWSFVWDAMQGLTLIILAVCAVVSLAIGIITEGWQGGWYDGGGIAFSILLVVFVTATSDYQQSLQFRDLNAEKKKIMIEVTRNSCRQKVLIFDLLVGDVVHLSIGNQVPADGLYFSGCGLSIDESSMTGESEQQKVNEEMPFLLSGTTVQDGSGKMLITGVGMNTEWGHLMATLGEGGDDETPLQVKLNGVATLIGKIGLLFAVVTFLVLLGRFLAAKESLKSWSVEDAIAIVNYFAIAITIIVVAVPEGLPLAVTLTLAFAIKKMMRDKALVRHLAACETTGSATTICSDKTGTLTRNNMTVTKAWVAGKVRETKDIQSELSEENFNILLEGMFINTGGDVSFDDGEPRVLGTPTEAAIVGFGLGVGGNFKDSCEKVKLLKMEPFNSKRKVVGVVVKEKGSRKVRAHLKGASEIILGRCDKYVNEDGRVVNLDDNKIEELKACIHSFADGALRTLCLAYKDVDSEPKGEEPVPEDGFVLVAIVGIKDPVRPGVKDAVELCFKAGIKVMARSSPSDKHTLVKELRAMGEVVAVTGDGTNDAPALHESDIGLAMGIAGTEVAKESADIVILDDKFQSIVVVAKWVCSVYSNIQKFVQFQLTVNLVALVINFSSACITGFYTTLQKTTFTRKMATSNKRREVDRSTERKYEDPILLRHHKIFLSHSGVQKEEFVEQLCVDLERRHCFPFFDKRPSSLPKGERFPDLIKAAVAQCEMMVVVVSEEYFASKWPMIELNGFMQATKYNRNLKVLPLFFGLNVDEFSNSKRQEEWFKMWETMAKDDKRIKVGEWKESLRSFGAFNGLVYDRHSKEVVAYRRKVVSNICKAIPSDIKYDESHVQGRSKLCQVIRDYFGKTSNSTKIPGVCVIGLYGLGGMGKTQICKLMCNEMDGEFDGKVCHVEMGKQSKHELIKKVLTTLTNTSVEVVQEVEEDKCEDVLMKFEVWKQKSFLTIDNVWDDCDSLELGKLCVRAPFVEGSWVIITSRLKKTLISLNVDENACFEMPELDKYDARDLFLYHAANGKKFEKWDDLNAIEKCIKSCYFGKGGDRGWHYHPLSLKALGVFLQYGGKKPSMWMKDLQKLKESSYLQEPKNPLFNILRINFDRLPKEEQELFMDVALFSPLSTPTLKLDLMQWLCLVHNKEKEEIENWLRHLVDSALLEHAETRSGEVSIHELYREFARLEAQGHLIPLDMEERRWVYARDALPREMEVEPRSSWKKLTRVCISESYHFVEKSGMRSLSAIEWKYCTNLLVLELYSLSWLSGVLNLKDLIRLRSFTVITGGRSPLKFSIEGLEGLKTLTYFKVICVFENQGAYVGQLPAALKVLEVYGAVVFERDVLALCTDLVLLRLQGVYIPDLDLRRCSFLQEVKLIHIHGLNILKLGPHLVSPELRRVCTSELDLKSCTSLQSLEISDCSDLVEVCGLDCLLGLLSLELVWNLKLSKLSNLTGLKHLHTLKCAGLDIDEVPGLDGLVGLKSLRIIDCRRLSKLPSLTGLQCLRELDIFGLGITEIPNLSGLKQLEVVDASDNSELTSLQGFGDLRALKTINLSYCKTLSRLSDMSKLANLKLLDLTHTEVDLHEEHIHMLQGLQALEEILLADLFSCQYGLDFKRHKIMHRCPNLRNRRGIEMRCIKGGREWKEIDLHHPSVAGHLVGKAISVPEVNSIWRLMFSET